MPTVNDYLIEFVRLEQERRELEANLKQVKDRLAALQDPIINAWIDSNQQSASIDGLTVYIRRDFYCNKKTGVAMAAVCRAIRNAGFAGMVDEAYNSSSLKSLVKEHVTEGKIDNLPAELRELLSYGELPRLVAVKA